VPRDHRVTRRCEKLFIGTEAGYEPQQPPKEHHMTKFSQTKTAAKEIDLTTLDQVIGGAVMVPDVRKAGERQTDIVLHERSKTGA
jgi:hypothetical protein